MEFEIRFKNNRYYYTDMKRANSNWANNLQAYGAQGVLAWKKEKKTNENKISIENYYKAFDFDHKLIPNWNSSLI